MTVSRTRRKKPRNDAEIVPFPDNWQPGAVDDNPHQTWGPNYDRRPLRASSVFMINKGGLICSFNLYVPLWGSDGFYIVDCRLVQGKKGGQRVLLPYQRYTSASGNHYFSDLLKFNSNRLQKDFEEASLRAIRAALATEAAEHPGPDDVPF